MNVFVSPKRMVRKLALILRKVALHFFNIEEDKEVRRAMETLVFKIKVLGGKLMEHTEREDFSYHKILMKEKRENAIRSWYL